MPLLDLPAEILLLIAQTLDSGSDINAFCQTNRALYSSVVRDYLYEYHANNEGGMLSVAVSSNNIKAVQRLLDKGANADEKDGYTPLYVAADHGYEEIARLLLYHGANINTTIIGNSSRLTPVCMAAEDGNTILLKMLLEHADGRIAYFDHALYFASQNGHEDAVRILLDKYQTFLLPNRYHPSMSDFTWAIDAAEKCGHEKIARMVRTSKALPPN